MTKLFIIAGNVNEFKNWCRENHDRLGAIYVDSIIRLKGTFAPHGRFIGTWYRRNDIEDIIVQLQIAGSITPVKAQEIINEYNSRQKNP